MLTAPYRVLIGWRNITHFVLEHNLLLPGYQVHNGFQKGRPYAALCPPRRLQIPLRVTPLRLVENLLARRVTHQAPMVIDVTDETYIVRFKPPQMNVQFVAASSAEIHGEHIALLNSNRQLVALLLLDIVESWSVV